MGSTDLFLGESDRLECLRLTGEPEETDRPRRCAGTDRPCGARTY